MMVKKNGPVNMKVAVPWWPLMASFALGLVPPPTPSGGARWYIPSPSPSRDLRLATASEASYVNRQWLDAILKNGVPPEDDHVIDAINRFEQRLQENGGFDKYAIWTPSGYANGDVLFLVVTSFETQDRVEIHHVVQSPYWDSDQISSLNLKDALTDLAHQDGAEIHFDHLYRSNDRYRLAWSQWSLNARHCFASEDFLS